MTLTNAISKTKEIKNELDLAFNNVKPNDWYFVIDLVQFRTGLGYERCVVDNLLLDHVELPYVLDLTVHLKSVSEPINTSSRLEGFLNNQKTNDV